MALAIKDAYYIRLGIIAVVLFVSIRYVLIPFYQRETEVREKIRLMEKTNETYTKILNRKDALKKNLHQLAQEEKRLISTFLEGNTASLAAAKLQLLLKNISTASEVELKRVRVKDPEAFEGFTSIPIELRFTTDLEKMTTFLHEIEQNKKSMIISNFKIHTRRRKDPKLLIVTLVVKGFMKRTEETVG